MHDVDELQATAARFAALLHTNPRSPARHLELLSSDPSGEGIADTLASGDPDRALDAINHLAGLLAQREGIGAEELAGQIYREAVHVVVSRPGLADTVAELESDLRAEGAEEFFNDEIFMQTIGATLLPLAGLDLEATFHFTRLFMDNFPSFSLPLGDYDLRATRWLAQLMDMGAIRAAYRDRFRDLATLADADAPLAAARLRAWVDGPPPADQTEDLPWMQGLLALARSQL